jgi:hypothetical protein
MPASDHVVYGCVTNCVKYVLLAVVDERYGMEYGYFLLHFPITVSSIDSISHRIRFLSGHFRGREVIFSRKVLTMASVRRVLKRDRVRNGKRTSSLSAADRHATGHAAIHWRSREGDNDGKRDCREHGMEAHLAEGKLDIESR